MKSCRVKKPRLAPLDVRVLGTTGATPVPSGQDLVTAEIAAVGQGSDLLATCGVLCLERHGRKLMTVVSLIGHLVGDDQMVLGFDGDLHCAGSMQGRARFGTQLIENLGPQRVGLLGRSRCRKRRRALAGARAETGTKARSYFGKGSL